MLDSPFVNNSVIIFQRCCWPDCPHLCDF